MAQKDKDYSIRDSTIVHFLKKRRKRPLSVQQQQQQQQQQHKVDESVQQQQKQQHQQNGTKYFNLGQQPGRTSNTQPRSVRVEGTESEHHHLVTERRRRRKKRKAFKDSPVLKDIQNSWKTAAEFQLTKNIPSSKRFTFDEDKIWTWWIFKSLEKTRKLIKYLKRKIN